MGVASILYTFTNLGRGLEYQTLTYNVVMLTVLLGIFAHGITAAPVRQASRKDDGARRYRDGRRDGDAAAGWSPRARLGFVRGRPTPADTDRRQRVLDPPADDLLGGVVCAITGSVVRPQCHAN